MSFKIAQICEASCLSYQSPNWNAARHFCFNGQNLFCLRFSGISSRDYSSQFESARHILTAFKHAAFAVWLSQFGLRRTLYRHLKILHHPATSTWLPRILTPHWTHVQQSVQQTLLPITALKKNPKVCCSLYTKHCMFKEYKHLCSLVFCFDASFLFVHNLPSTLW